MRRDQKKMQENDVKKKAGEESERNLRRATPIKIKKRIR